ncbi:hypothetical protein [Trichocoleus sp. FACHB-262]|uniref:hypothetical protein n=1 Tax=Trichocoleus sp. FACHB-262 TaxID=2692869 RepID=UPI001682F70D|nr:hypothetical protein [Trichocoleus sp. FACHB-262]MBD2119547.1 hypothetical protein [Trichocoleus sp. FACHB-262]
MSFRATFFTKVGFHPHLLTSYGDFTLTGPNVDRLKPLPGKLRHVVCDPATEQLYGLSTHQVFQVSLENKTATEMKLTDNVPRLSWPCGIAFDTKRQRLIVVSGYMYEYLPATQQWAVVTDMQNINLAALTYEPKEDRFYGILKHHSSSSQLMIAQYNAEGALLEAIDISHDLISKVLSKYARDSSVQLFIVENDLVILTSDHMLVVNPTSKIVELTWERYKPVSEDNVEEPN